MSYSSIIEGLPEPLRHPSRLAIIASVAFHGAAFAVLPFLPTPSTAVNTQRMVNLIELSAAEQNRLPQVSASQLPPAGSASGGLPPLGLGTLPPGLPNYSVDSPIAFDPSIPRALPEFNAPVVIPLPTRPSQPPPDPDPSAAPLPGNQALEVPQSNSNVPPFDPNQLPGVAPANPAIPPGPSPEPFFRLPDPGTTEGSIASVPSPSPSSQPPTTLPARPGSESQPPAPLPAGPGSEWLVEARRVSGDPALTIQTQAVTLPYPEKLCNSPLKGPVPVQVLALVNPTGKLVELSGSIGGLRLLESTGYPTLNNVALDPANYPIRATGQYQAIWYSSEFTYSGKDCAASELGRPAKKSPSPTAPRLSPSDSSPSPSGPLPSPSGPSPSPKNLSPSPTPTPTTSTSSPTSPSLAPETLEVPPSPSSNTPSLNQILPLPEASEAPLAPTPEKPEATLSPTLEMPQVAPPPEAAKPQAPAPEPSSPSPTN